MKRTVIAYICLLFMSIGYYGIILSYSAAPASESSARSRGITKKIVEIYDSVMMRKSTEKVKNERVISLHGFVRKCAHVYNFMVLAFAHIMLFFVAGNGNIRKAVLFTLIMGICAAVLDETLQLFVSGRAGQLKDVFIDFIGTCQGCIAFLVVKKLYINEGGVL